MLLYNESLSFEKLVGVVTILIMLTLLACGAFYFRRRISNLESVLKDQAKVTQNVLQMMNTMIPHEEKHETNTMSTIFDNFPGEHHVIAVGGWMSQETNETHQSNYEKFIDVTDKESSGLIEVSDVEDTKSQDIQEVVEDVKEYIQEHNKEEHCKDENLNYEKMKVDELRDLIEKRGLPNPGKNKLKKELIQILEA